jgi:hypothetical protein
LVNDTITLSQNARFTDIQWKHLLTVNFTAMTPHVGHLFELRVVKVENQEEAGRFSLPALLVPNYTIYVPSFDINKDYNIDFYADHNGNGSNNVPPADHAWRITFNSSIGDFGSDFSYNASFVDIQWPGATVVDGETNVPDNFFLKQNYPNPFNPSTTIKYQIALSNPVSLKIYDILGNEVAPLVNEVKPAGNFEVYFDASLLSSGTYFYKLQAGQFSDIKKMLLTK